MSPSFILKNLMAYQAHAIEHTSDAAVLAKLQSTVFRYEASHQESLPKRFSGSGLAKIAAPPKYRKPTPSVPAPSGTKSSSKHPTRKRSISRSKESLSTPRKTTRHSEYKPHYKPYNDYRERPHPRRSPSPRDHRSFRSTEDRHYDPKPHYTPHQYSRPYTPRPQQPPRGPHMPHDPAARGPYQNNWAPPPNNLSRWSPPPRPNQQWQQYGYPPQQVSHLQI